jgi:N6-adenosine-specific RNA methylase IME4
MLLEEQILDGRNRYRACLQAGREPLFLDYLGDDPLGFVISKNLHRRHLDTSQRAMIAAELANMRQGERTDLQPSANLQKVDRASAATMLNVSERSVASAHAIHEQGDPDLVRAVKTGKVKISTAADIAALPKEEQRALLANFDNREILDAAKEIRSARAAANRARWTARTIELSKVDAPLPRDRRYPVIYADPPWAFDVYDAESGLDRCAAAHYPTLELEEICALPVADLATPDAVLFLWSTCPHLKKALQVLDAWGFEYRTNIVWVKNQPGLGYWVRNQHELLLIGARGDMRSPAEDARPPSVITAPKREHSHKPDEAYALIERMYPDLPRIELFARGEARPGWVVWGNEAPAPAPPDDGLDLPALLRREPAP